MFARSVGFFIFGLFALVVGEYNHLTFRTMVILALFSIVVSFLTYAVGPTRNLTFRD